MEVPSRVRSTRMALRALPMYAPLSSWSAGCWAAFLAGDALRAGLTSGCTAPCPDTCFTLQTKHSAPPRLVLLSRHDDRCREWQQPAHIIQGCAKLSMRPSSPGLLYACVFRISVPEHVCGLQEMSAATPRLHHFHRCTFWALQPAHLPAPPVQSKLDPGSRPCVLPHFLSVFRARMEGLHDTSHGSA